MSNEIEKNYESALKFVFSRMADDNDLSWKMVHEMFSNPSDAQKKMAIQYILDMPIVSQRDDKHLTSILADSGVERDELISSLTASMQGGET